MPAPPRPARRRPVPAAAPASRRWLLLVHQLPARPTSLRVRTWRRLQQLGAIAVKQAVYVLPDSPAAREDFEWLKAEIEGAGGQAAVFSADTVDTWTTDGLVDEFRRTREAAYAALADDAEQLLRQLDRPRRRRGPGPSSRRLPQLRERLAAVERVDFFGAAGRDRVTTLLRQIEERTLARTPGRAAKGQGHTPQGYQGRLWVTRPRPGVDRMASAWLITRFIDPDARFAFVADRASAPDDSVPFDMFGVEFTHRAEQCTFEMLCDTFNLEQPALTKIAAIVHDLDLKDGRFGAADAPTVGAIIDGLRLAQADDHALLADGITLFDALYRAFAQEARPRGPRPVAPRRQAASSRRPRRGR